MKIRTALLSLLLATSCGDFLDVQPNGSQTGTDMATVDGTQRLLIGTYAMLDGMAENVNSNYSAAASDWLYGSISGGDAHVGSDPTRDSYVYALTPIELQDCQPYHEVLNFKWKAVYEGVSRANEVLKILPHVTRVNQPTDTAQIHAEARVLRGIFHLEAAKLWNRVPYIDEYTDPNTATNEEDILPKIEADFRFGYDHLPVKTDVGRVNKWAAAAYLAKALLFQHKYADAKEVLNDIYDKGATALGTKFALMPLFSQNFNSAQDENNAESVFAFQYSVNDHSLGWNASFGEVLNYPVGVSCCGYFQPSVELANSYRTDVAGLPLLDGRYNDDEHMVKNDDGFESSDVFLPDAGNLDPRIDWTIGRRGLPYLDWDIHPGKDWILNQGFAGPYSPKKNVFYRAQTEFYTEQSTWTTGFTAINYRAIRFADVILWLAESEVEAGSLENARGYVNMIRARAANPAGFVKNADGVTAAANYVISLYPDHGYPFDTQENARKAIHFERKLELAMEGHRFFDLVRWGEADATINAYITYEKMSRPHMDGAHFEAGTDEYFPIPQAQIDLMGADILHQNR